MWKGDKINYLRESAFGPIDAAKNLFVAISIFVLAVLSTGCGAGFEVLFDNDVPDTRFRIYWSENTGSIKRASTDRSLQEEIITVTGTPLDIELYMPGQKIYWTEDTGTLYVIKSANIDGTGAGTFFTSDVSDYHGPTAIAIDSNDAVIYWNRHQYTSGLNDVWRSSLSSLAPEKWQNDLPYDYTYCIALDTANRKLYFNAHTYWDINNSLGSGLVGAMYTGSMDTADSDTFSFAASGPVDPSVPLRGIAVDVFGGHVYYVDNQLAAAIIKRTDLSFGNSTDWITSNGLFDINQLALDLQEGKIYWTSKADNRIYRANINAPESGVEIFIQLTAAPTGIAISP